jgi:hypothetical protein
LEIPSSGRYGLSQKIGELHNVTVFRSKYTKGANLI